MLLEIYDKEYDAIPFEDLIEAAKEYGVTVEDIFEITPDSKLMNPDMYFLAWHRAHGTKTMLEVEQDKKKVLTSVKGGRVPHIDVIANYLDSKGLHHKYDKIPPATLGRFADGRYRAMLASILGIKVPVITK